MDTDELTYGSYLRVPELLALQRPRSRPPHPEELHFIVVHQALELWMKLLQHDLGRIVGLLDGDAFGARPGPARPGQPHPGARPRPDAQPPQPAALGSAPVPQLPGDGQRLPVGPVPGAGAALGAARARLPEGAGGRVRRRPARAAGRPPGRAVPGRRPRRRGRPPGDHRPGVGGPTSTSTRARGPTSTWSARPWSTTTSAGSAGARSTWRWCSVPSATTRAAPAGWPSPTCSGPRATGSSRSCGRSATSWWSGGAASWSGGREHETS